MPWETMAIFSPQRDGDADLRSYAKPRLIVSPTPRSAMSGPRNLAAIAKDMFYFSSIFFSGMFEFAIMDGGGDEPLETSIRP